MAEQNQLFLKLKLNQSNYNKSDLPISRYGIS